VTPLAWLAIPLIATLVAALAVPKMQRRRSQGLTAAQRADRLRHALAGDLPADTRGARQ
jgi:hypothetical protein